MIHMLLATTIVLKRRDSYYMSDFMEFPSATGALLNDFCIRCQEFVPLLMGSARR